MRKNIGNKGFSMVELLVGITILIVIAVPLIMAFLTSARTTNKAREMRNQTTAATNIIEIYKATDIAAIIDGLIVHNNSLGTVATITGLDKLVTDSGGSHYETVAPIDYSTLDTAATGYRLTLTDVAGGSKTYDAMLYIDAQKYVLQNSAPIVDYKPMDAVYVQPDPTKDPLNDPDLIAAKNFASQAQIDSGAIVQYSVFLNTMNRKMTVSIDKIPSSPGSLSGIVTSKVLFHYDTVFTYSLTDTSVTPSLTTQYTKTYSTDISNDFYSGNYSPGANGINGLYFFYNPNITSNLADTDDVIWIENRENIPTSIYLIRQGNAIQTYQTDIRLNEKYVGSPNEIAKMYSNMTCAFHVYMGFPMSGGGYNDYWFHNKSFTGVLIGTPPQNRLYDIKVSLYKAGANFAGDALSTFDASTLQ